MRKIFCPVHGAVRGAGDVVEFPDSRIGEDRASLNGRPAAAVDPLAIFQEMFQFRAPIVRVGVVQAARVVHEEVERADRVGRDGIVDRDRCLGVCRTQRQGIDIGHAVEISELVLADHAMFFPWPDIRFFDRLDEIVTLGPGGF